MLSGRVPPAVFLGVRRLNKRGVRALGAVAVQVPVAPVMLAPDSPLLAGRARPVQPARADADSSAAQPDLAGRLPRRDLPVVVVVGASGPRRHTAIRCISSPSKSASLGRARSRLRAVSQPANRFSSQRLPPPRPRAPLRHSGAVGGVPLLAVAGWAADSDLAGKHGDGHGGSTGMGTLIEMLGVTREYDIGTERIKALNAVDIAVAAGEFVAIMGPSGSGKSTTMNVIGCLDKPTAGRYVLDGVDVSQLDDAALAGLRNVKIGFVFQQFNLLARTTALENVELPMMYAGVPRRERRERAQAVLERVGLGDRLHNRPNELSGGQQQRVSIARALVNNPAIILADEPTGALDSHTTAEILGLFAQLHAQGNTIVMVTHEPDVGRRAKRIIRFRDGRVESDSAIEDVTL